MKYVIKSKHTHPESLKKRYGEAAIIDVTSRGPDPWVQFSPFYPHGNIPIPMSPGVFSMSVEGIWQGLKVFESADVDPSKFAVTSMKGIKRTVRRFGSVLGHRAGTEGTALLPYKQARYDIYLPAYRWVLENRLSHLIEEIKEINRTKDVVFLDYETNPSVENVEKPLSHAALIKLYIEDAWPTRTET
ncbi:MAG: hypothetical protein GY754_33910 [bacterium]|nr:hypothetical protein [bacterium]